MPADINDCVAKYPSLVNYSRYAMQLAPWRDRFSDTMIHVLLFEEFVADRRQAMRRLGEFLGFQPRLLDVDPQTVANQSADKPVLNRFWLKLHRHPAYQVTLRRMVPTAMRSEFRRLLLPKAPPRPMPPSLNTVDRIQSEVAQDELALRDLMGRDMPLWDFAKVREGFEHIDSVPAA